jgi:hypothetical protein
MRSLRVLANRVLWRWSLRDVLPGYYVHRVPVTEYREPLQPIPAVPGRLPLDPRSASRTWRDVRSQVRCTKQPNYYLTMFTPGRGGLPQPGAPATIAGPVLILARLTRVGQSSGRLLRARRPTTP